MFRKKLITCLTQVLMIGGMLYSSTGMARNYYAGMSPSMAYQVYSHANGGYSHFSPQFKRQFRPEYRFRPLPRQHQVRFNFATGNYYQPRWKVVNQKTMQSGQPAFARQYGWAPAKKMTVRRVTESNHYASSTNSEVESFSTAPVYRTAPISTQGFRYRDMRRNAPFVSFSDRVKKSSGLEQTFAVQRPQVNHVKIQPLKKETATRVEPNRVLPPGISDNYSFRPDQRFSSNPGRTQLITSPQPEKRDFHLVDVKVEEPGDKFLDNWSFRPVESTF